MPPTILALFLLVFSLLSILRFGRVKILAKVDEGEVIAS